MCSGMGTQFVEKLNLPGCNSGIDWVVAGGESSYAVLFEERSLSDRVKRKGNGY